MIEIFVVESSKERWSIVSVLAERLGGAIVPLALAYRDGAVLRAMVAPSFVPRDHDFARAVGPGNVIRVHGQDSGKLQFSGQGAGRVPTASAVFSDLAEITHKMARWEYLGSDPLPDEPVSLQGVTLPVILRVPVEHVASVSAALGSGQIEVRRLAENALLVSGCEIQELDARIKHILPEAADVCVFPCFEFMPNIVG